MSELMIPFEEKMEKTLSNLSEELSTIRAGRANPAVLNKVTVDYYGCPTPIQQMANISVPEARILVVQPWDKSMLKAVEKVMTKCLPLLQNALKKEAGVEGAPAKTQM